MPIKKGNLRGKCKKGRESGHWVKTLSDVSMTTSQTEIVFDFVNQSIQSENLNLNDVIMLKFLKRIDIHRYAIFKIFSSIDVNNKKHLYMNVNKYAKRKIYSIRVIHPNLMNLVDYPITGPVSSSNQSPFLKSQVLS